MAERTSITCIPTPRRSSSSCRGGAGTAWGDDYYEIGPGDVVFVPVNTAHSAGSIGDEDMVILWVLGGVPSMERAGYQAVAVAPGIPAG